MGSKWQEASFAAMATLSRDSVRPEDAAGLPYIGLEHIGEGSLQLLGAGVAEDASSLKSRFREGDILFGKLRPYFRKVVRAPFNGICSTDIWVVRPRLGVDRDYLFYRMASDGFLEPIVRASEGTKMPRAKWEYAAGLAFQLPSLDEQERIAGVLAALDDKIELNRRMADTLDEIAQTLFRLWFVEPAGHSWPSGGEGLPEGWTVERLGEHVDAVRGLSYSGGGLTDDANGLPMHNLNSVFEGGGYKRDGLKRYTGEYKERHKLGAGELVVTNTEQGFEFLLIGYPALIPRCFGEQGLFSHHLYRVRPKTRSPLTTTYLYWLLRDQRMHRVLAGFTNGTTVNMLPLDGLDMPKVLVPPGEMVQEFTDAVAPMQELRECLESESDTLREIRDALLPPLLDGRVEVPPAADQGVS